MNIHPVKGDIAEVGPRLANLVALWVRSGYYMRNITWETMRDRYPELGAAHGGANAERPWEAPMDQVFEVDPPDKNLRLVYLFSNPHDASGEPSLTAVRNAVRRCLDRASQYGVQTIAMIHIPYSPIGEKGRDERDEESAKAMIDSALQWAAAHPGRIIDLFLVDLDGAFGGPLQGGG
jgi:hypothetical protein